MMDIRGQFAQRLAARRKSLELRIEDVCQLMPSKPSPTRYHNWESGIRLPKIEQIAELGEALNVPPGYLVSFTNEMNDLPSSKASLSPLQSAIVSTSSGEAYNLESDRDIAFSNDALAAHGLRDNRLVLIEATDSSMSPVIVERDKVLIDRDRITPETRDIFAMLVNGRVWFRWITPELDGSFTVWSEDGQTTQHTKIEAENLDSLCIIGRVAGVSRFR